MRNVLTIGIILILQASAVAQQVTYTLKATPKTVAWGCDKAKAEPVFSPSHK